MVIRRAVLTIERLDKLLTNKEGNGRDLRFPLRHLPSLEEERISQVHKHWASRYALGGIRDQNLACRIQRCR